MDSNASARADLLASLDLLDSPSEEVFDRITRLLARVLDVPIALVSLLDTDRQWFKSRVGLDVSETPLAVSFCAHAAEADAPLVVHNALEDARFAQNPLVLGAPNIRFYAGVPIHSSDGVPLGTLCAIGRRPRTLQPDELQVLHDLGQMVERELAYRETSRTARQAMHHSDELVRESQFRMRVTFEQAAVGIALVEPDGHWQRVNRRLCDIVGYTEHELMRLTFQDITHPADLQSDLHMVQRLLDNEIPHYSLEKRYIRKDGHTVWVNLTVALIRKPNGAPNYFITIIEDIQGRKDTEDALAALRQQLEQRVHERTLELQQAHDRLAVALHQGELAARSLATREAELVAIIRNAPDAYISMDESGRVTEWNRQAEEMLGWERSETLGQALDKLIIPEALREAHQHGLKRYLRTGVGKVLNQRVELSALRRDGTEVPVEVRITALVSDSGRMFCAFITDITERKRLQSFLLAQALRDPLTGLPNRRALNDRLPEAIARAKRSGQAVAVLFMDLDGFKSINDRLGHQRGDTLLQQFAERVSTCIRRSDTLARLAGDEFVVLLEGMADPDNDPISVARKILDKASQPFDLDEGVQGHIGASIGIAVYRRGDSEDAELLLQAADERMYRAKAEGKGQAWMVASGLLPGAEEP
ncbi:PAS domain S-box protein [Aquabacterium soli]|uniref:PAS domain S-box protein n=1 Tax=Aquabacterium soli TaxID=2493092 RepID=A0A426VBI9_9BURK|nr:PAS domain S-box protein [Aquabacterium soli]RRS04242.1 PAS domain S-box protein [Aquabacterium soli]